MANGFLARGKVTSAKDSSIVFEPLNSNYQLHLRVSTPYTGPMGQLIDGRIRAKAKKIYTVPSGGGFISPIFGPPKTVQGRTLHVEERTIVLRAGVVISIELPLSEDAVDLEQGAITVGSIVNAVTLPGATFELVGSLQSAK